MTDGKLDAIGAGLLGMGLVHWARLVDRCRQLDDGSMPIKCRTLSGLGPEWPDIDVGTIYLVIGCEY